MIGLTGVCLIRKLALAAIAICVVMQTGVVSQASSAKPQETQFDIAGLSWMSGDWELTNGDRYIDEHWSVPSGGMMLGMGHTVIGGKTKFFEYLRIETRADGIYYVAQPLGKPAIDFRLVKMTGREAVFDNPGHSDHIKHIYYKSDSDNSLTGRVEGADNGKAFASEFAYQRIKSR